jgi:hypothetical protein
MQSFPCRATPEGGQNCCFPTTPHGKFEAREAGWRKLGRYVAREDFDVYVTILRRARGAKAAINIKLLQHVIFKDCAAPGPFFLPDVDAGSYT